MKVKHLIAKLLKCNPEAMVVIDGPEHGVTELKKFNASVELALNIYENEGEHEVLLTRADIHENFYNTKRAKAVYLSR